MEATTSDSWLKTIPPSCASRQLVEYCFAVLRIKTSFQEALNATNSQILSTWKSSRLTIITASKNYVSLPMINTWFLLAKMVP